MKKALFVTCCTLICFSLWFGINYYAFLLPNQWDVTRAKQHTLSPLTIESIINLKQDIKVSALIAGLPPKYLEDLFREYTKISKGRIATEIIDPIQQIGYAAQFGNVINVQERKVFVSSGSQKKEVSFTEKPLSQEQLTNAIIQVNQPQRYVYFLTGHGEYSIESKVDKGLLNLVRMLDSNNFISKELMLAKNPAIPNDCSLLVIAGAQNQLTDQEIKIIQAFLEQGGRALFLIENVIVTTPDKPLTAQEFTQNASLNEILNSWGLQVGADIVVDLASHAGQDVGSPATKNYGKHKALTEGLDYTFYVRPRSISVIKDVRPTIKLASIVSSASSKESWAESDRTLNVSFNELSDIPGPVPIAFAVYEEKQKNDVSDTRLIVFTDADFLSNAYINHYSNAQMGLHVINWLTETDYKVFVDQANIQIDRLEFNKYSKTNNYLDSYFHAPRRCPHWNRCLDKKVTYKDCYT